MKRPQNKLSENKRPISQTLVPWWSTSHEAAELKLSKKLKLCFLMNSSKFECCDIEPRGCKVYNSCCTRCRIFSTYSLFYRLTRHNGRVIRLETLNYSFVNYIKTGLVLLIRYNISRKMGKWYSIDLTFISFPIQWFSNSSSQKQVV